MRFLWVNNPTGERCVHDSIIEKYHVFPDFLGFSDITLPSIYPQGNKKKYSYGLLSFTNHPFTLNCSIELLVR